jgi:hypothetical protein
MKANKTVDFVVKIIITTLVFVGIYTILSIVQHGLDAIKDITDNYLITFFVFGALSGFSKYHPVQDLLK